MKWTMGILAVCLPALATIAAFLPEGRCAANTFPDLLHLPDGWLPEGVATGRGPVIYAGSRLHGAIYAFDLRTGKGRVAVPPQEGRIAVGLAFDHRTNFVFAAGGGGGAAYVYDAKTGESVGAYPLVTDGGPTFVNDAVVTRDAAYLTESQRPVIYRIPLGPGGRLPEADAVETIPLGGDYQHAAGTNANGIEATPDGSRLIIVQSNQGLLFTVDPRTGDAARIDLDGYSVTNGDGLLLEGRTLYVVRNRLNLIAELRLAHDLSSGELVEEIVSPHFDVPTTLSRFGNGLYAVNARFSTPPTPDTTYTIVRVGR